MTIGEEIKKIRLKNGLSQEEFGKRIRLSQMGISKIERGSVYPRIQTVEKINKEFSVSLTNKNSLVGKRFGKLTVLEFIKDGKWLCKCDCGKTINVLKSNLLSGNSTKCNNCKSKETENYKKMQNEECINKRNKANEKYHVDGTSIPNLYSKKYSNNTSGVKGVGWDKKNRKWISYIGFKGKSYKLGRFKEKEDAIKARKEAEEKYFKPIIEEFKEQEVK